MQKKIVHIALFFAILLCSATKVLAQDYPWLSHNNFMVEARAHYGFFWHHHFEMQRFHAHYPAVEISLFQNTYGKREWEAIYNYPHIGATLYMADFGLNYEQNPEVGKALGSVIALYPYINYPLNHNENSQITFKLGIGLAYLTKCFDNIENYQNYAIGSHLNAAANLSFEYRQRITYQLISVASFGLTHFSNGSTKLPNYGLNTFSGAWGLAYYLRDPRINMTPSKRPDYVPFEFDKKKWFSVDVNYGIGFKNVAQTHGGPDESFMVHDLSTYLLAQFTLCSRAGIGLDLALDLSDQTLPNHYVDDEGIHAIVHHMDAPADTSNIKALQMLKPNFSLCYSMTMNRLSYYFEFGWHLKLNRYTDMSKGNIFQKVTMRYQLKDNLYGHLALMTHFGRADYLCFGLGYRFNQKYYLNYEKNHKRYPPGMRKHRFWFL